MRLLPRFIRSVAGLGGMIVVLLFASAASAEAPDPICAAPASLASVAAKNAANLTKLPINLFGKAETGFKVYSLKMQVELGTDCALSSPGFADALKTWQTTQGLKADGMVTVETLVRLKTIWQDRRPIYRIRKQAGGCPNPPADKDLSPLRDDEKWALKDMFARTDALEAYRKMVAAARAEVPALANSPVLLKAFSTFRSPSYDAARCKREKNCNGVGRAVCSPHRTGVAFDIYVGGIATSTATANRLIQVQSPAYIWLTNNAHRFGFYNYAFEPWHWEWSEWG